MIHRTQVPPSTCLEMDAVQAPSNAMSSHVGSSSVSRTTCRYDVVQRVYHILQSSMRYGAHVGSEAMHVARTPYRQPVEMKPLTRPGNRSDVGAKSYTFRTIHEQNTPQTTSITPIRGYEKTRAASGGRRSVVRVAWGRELQLYDREAGGGLSTSTYKHTAEKEEKTASTRPATIVQETSEDHLGVSISEDRDK